MDLSNYEVGNVKELTEQKCVVELNGKSFEIDKLHGPVLVPGELQVCDKVKVIVVNEAVRHIEKLNEDEEAKLKSGLVPEKKEIRKIQKKIKADQFFSMYDKGFKQKVYMYKVGDNDFRGKAKKKG